MTIQNTDERDVRDIIINLRRDFVEHIRATLILSGYSQRSVDRVAIDDRKIISYYLGICRRSISSTPRSVHRSKSFTCPPKHAAVLADIERKIISGDDLSIYLSTDIRQLTNVDYMLNTWGIHHLHLGNVTRTGGKNRGFVKRTRFLLFCHFTAGDAYFIGVFHHDSFSSQNVMQIMHDNWSNTLDEYRLHGVTGDQLSEEQAREQRRKRMNYVLTMQDSTVYLPPGNGTTLSGENVADIIETDWWLDRLRHMQQSISGFIEREKARIVPPLVFPVELRLCIVLNEFCVEDVHSRDIYRVTDHGTMRISGFVDRDTA